MYRSIFVLFILLLCGACKKKGWESKISGKKWHLSLTKTLASDKNDKWIAFQEDHQFIMHSKIGLAGMQEAKGKWLISEKENQIQLFFNEAVKKTGTYDLNILMNEGVGEHIDTNNVAFKTHTMELADTMSGFFKESDSLIIIRFFDKNIKWFLYAPESLK